MRKFIILNKSSKMAVILAVESSCDETSVSIVTNRKVLSNVVASQVKLHEEDGGGSAGVSFPSTLGND